jgi:hypothetical protein
MDDSEIKEQKRHDRRKEREAAEADRVRKLEDLALAADEFLKVHYEFEGTGSYESAVSEYVDALDDKRDALDEEIQKIRDKRRA